MGQMRYRVYFTPLENADSNLYGDEIDVSDRVELNGIGNISRTIDSSDYDIGVFTFSDLELTGFNYNGYFNDIDDTRSIFMSGRDRCKVRVVFEDIELTRNASGTVLSETVTDTVTFHGIINEEATRLDIVTERIRLKVLSRDSVLRTTKVSAGAVTGTMTFKQAIETILNVPRITSVLNFSAGNINPDLNLMIDLGSYFDNRSVKESLDKLLIASNSVLLVNDAGDLIVQSRLEDSTRDVLNLYGKNDTYKRENIIDITAYNSGKQRMFTSIVVNDFERSNTSFVQAFGLRQKTISLPFITNQAKAEEIADRLVDEFKTPKVELNVKVATRLSRSVQLLDRVSVNYPLRLKPPAGKFLPVVGITQIGDSMMPLPETYGSIAISSRTKFKVIEITDNPDRFTTILKLRQAGTGTGDGVFDLPNNCLISFAVIGEARICSGGDTCDAFNPSIIGAALVGCTQIA